MMMTTDSPVLTAEDLARLQGMLDAHKDCGGDDGCRATRSLVSVTFSECIAAARIGRDTLRALIAAAERDMERRCGASVNNGFMVCANTKPCPWHTPTPDTHATDATCDELRKGAITAFDPHAPGEGCVNCCHDGGAFSAPDLKNGGCQNPLCSCHDEPAEAHVECPVCHRTPCGRWDAFRREHLATDAQFWDADETGTEEGP